jgi:hypothetical protein
VGDGDRSGGASVGWGAALRTLVFDFWDVDKVVREHGAGLVSARPTSAEWGSPAERKGGSPVLTQIPR